MLLPESLGAESLLWSSIGVSTASSSVGFSMPDSATPTGSSVSSIFSSAEGVASCEGIDFSEFFASEMESSAF